MHSEGPLSTRLLGPRVHPNRVLSNGPGPAPRPGGRGSCLCLWFCDGPLLSRPAPLRAQAPSPAVSPARRLLSVAPSMTPRLCFCELWTCPQCSSVPAVVSALGGEEGAGEGCSALHGQRRGADSSRWGCLWGTDWANKSLLRVRPERVSALGARQRALPLWDQRQHHSA